MHLVLGNVLVDDQFFAAPATHLGCAELVDRDDGESLSQKALQDGFDWWSTQTASLQ